jgi:hypothetical protein
MVNDQLNANCSNKIIRLRRNGAQLENGRSGIASNPVKLSSPAVLILLLLFLSFVLAVPGCAQSSFSDGELSAHAKQFFAEQRWQEIVNLGETAQHPSADFDFYYGSALAQLGRLADAQRASRRELV